MIRCTIFCGLSLLIVVNENNSALVLTILGSDPCSDVVVEYGMDRSVSFMLTS